jgi:hypothetical protein
VLLAHFLIGSTTEDANPAAALKRHPLSLRIEARREDLASAALLVSRRHQAPCLLDYRGLTVESSGITVGTGLIVTGPHPPSRPMLKIF